MVTCFILAHLFLQIKLPQTLQIILTTITTTITEEEDVETQRDTEIFISTSSLHNNESIKLRRGVIRLQNI